MADKDTRKLEEGSNIPSDLTGELLHDYLGEQYLINNDHYKKQLDQRRNSDSKEQDLRLARELLQSNLRQLTDKQKDVMYYTMQSLTQAQIAIKMKISQTSVSQHLQAARKKLAKLIQTTKEVMNNGNWNDTETNIRD